jgi:hypothetical protein
MNRPSILVLVFLASTSNPALMSSRASKNPQTSQSQFESNSFLRQLNNGTWWNNIPQQQKHDFVDGYVTAMANVNNRTALALFNSDKKQLVATDPQFQARMDALLD